MNKPKQIFSVIIKKIVNVAGRKSPGGMIDDLRPLTEERVLQEVDLSADEVIDMMAWLASTRGERERIDRQRRFRQ